MYQVSAQQAVAAPPAVPLIVVGPARGRLAGGLVRTARPRQWAKNLLVFAAPGAAGALTQLDTVWRATAAFALFCVASSGTYFVNDAADRDHDRAHPTKRHRPVASGVVPAGLAVGLGVALLAAAVAVSYAVLGGGFAIAVAAYVAVNAAYNLRLRNEAVLDLAAVASGFVIRAVAGGLATGVRVSEWFLVVISFASLFVVAGKRTASATVVGAEGAEGASPRVEYPESFLRFVRLLGSGVAVTAYGLWAFDKAASGGSVWFELTIVPFGLALLRYALLVERGEGERPEDLLLGDRTILALTVLWAALLAIGIYGS